MSNYQQRISALVAFVDYICNIPRAERACNQVSDVKEAKEKELAFFNKTPIMNGNCLGFTCYNELLKKILTKGQALLQAAQLVEDEQELNQKAFTSLETAALE